MENTMKYKRLPSLTVRAAIALKAEGLSYRQVSNRLNVSYAGLVANVKKAKRREND